MNATEVLEALGLTQIEALAYTYLVANPSATGYRVSRGIAKPTANVYRALEGLERKGAVLRDRARVPLFRAVAPGDLLSRLEQQFRERREIAARELTRLQTDEDDERHYGLSSLDQVVSRARIMLAATRRDVLIDAPASIIERLADAIADARSRGGTVLAIARGVLETDEPDTWVDAASRRGERAPLRMVIDSREAMLAAVSQDVDRVRDAMWTRSRAVARVLHDAITSELLFLSLERGLEDGLSVDEMEAMVARCRELREDSES